MKKYFNMVRNIIFYSGIKIILQFVIDFIFCMIQTMIHPYQSYEYIMESFEKNKYCLILGVNLVLLFVFILILSNRDENLWKRCRFKKIDYKTILNSVLLGLGISIILLNVMSFTGELKGLNDKIFGIGRIVKCPMGIFNIIVFIPVFEEILFRGLIFRELKNNINIIVSIIIQAVIFSLFYAEIINIQYGFFMGIILGIIYHWIGSIWTNTIVHIVMNSFFIAIFNANYLKFFKFNLSFFIIGVCIFAISAIFLYKIFKKNDVFQVNDSL